MIIIDKLFIIISPIPFVIPKPELSISVPRNSWQTYRPHPLRSFACL